MLALIVALIVVVATSDVTDSDSEQGILTSAAPINIDGCMNQSAYNYMIEAQTQSDEVYCTVAAELLLTGDMDSILPHGYLDDHSRHHMAADVLAITNDVFVDFIGIRQAGNGIIVTVEVADTSIATLQDTDSTFLMAGAPVESVTVTSTPNTAIPAEPCLVDEYAFAGTCVACFEGESNEAGDLPSGPNTACTLQPITGMCAGNTEATADATCGEDLILKPDPTTIEGTDEEACCDEEPQEPPNEVWVWEATPWSACEFGCGTRAPQTRTVKCVKLSIYATGAVVHEDSFDYWCPDDKPAEEETCEIMAASTQCDDSNADTTGDACTAGNATGVCEGKKVLVSALTFDIPIDDLELPAAGASPEELTASPVAVVLANWLTTSLSSSLGEGIEVVILGLSAGSLVVDYKVKVPATTTVDETAKNNAVDAIAAAPAVEIPTTSETPITASAPEVEPFKSYAYVRTAGLCPARGCSQMCGAEEVTARDAWLCMEDGVDVAEDSCVSAGIGEAPSSETFCCPAADDDTCEESAEEITRRVNQGRR